MRDFQEVWPDLLGGTIGLLIVYLLFRFIVRPAKKTVITPEPGVIVLRMSSAIGRLGWVAFFVLFPFLIVIFFIPYEKPWHLLIALVLVLLLMTAPVILILTARNRKLIADETGFTYTGFTGRKRTVLWSQIIRVSSPRSTNLLIIKTEEHTVKINPMLIGFNDFSALLKDKVPASYRKDLYGNKAER